MYFLATISPHSLEYTQTHTHMARLSFLLSLLLLFFIHTTQGQTVYSISITDTMQAITPYHLTLMGCLWLDSAPHIKQKWNDYQLLRQPSVGCGAIIWPKKAQFRGGIKDATFCWCNNQKLSADDMRRQTWAYTNCMHTRTHIQILTCIINKTKIVKRVNRLFKKKGFVCHHMFSKGLVSLSE